MSERWRIWFRTISSNQCGNWRSFFVIHDCEEEAIEALMKLHHKEHEYLMLPDGEQPVEDAVMDGDGELA